MNDHKSISPMLPILIITVVVTAFVGSTLVGCKRPPERETERSLDEPGDTDSSLAAVSTVQEPAAPEAQLAEPAGPAPKVADMRRAASPFDGEDPRVVRDRPTATAPAVAEPVARPEPVVVAPVEPFDPDSLHSLMAVAATGVDKRVPQQVGSTFAKGEYVWAFTKVKNTGAETHVRMVWKKDGKVRSNVQLRVGKSPGWRTWSKHKMRSNKDLGEWVVEVQDADGNVLEEIDFKVGHSSDVADSTDGDE